MALLRRTHIYLLAWIVTWLRTRYLIKQFKIAHAREITVTPMQSLPMTMARHDAELRAVRAGRMDLAGLSATEAIVDRKSLRYPFLPTSISRLQLPLMKATPYNLRRLGRTPVARRAINMIKGAMISLIWDVEPVDGAIVDDPEEQKERLRIAKKMFERPNNDDSFQSLMEMGLEDMLIFGAFAAEMEVTLNPERPLKLWAVQTDSISIMPRWTEAEPDEPRYAQRSLNSGQTRPLVVFYDDELMYLRDNPSTETPFGLGALEVAFQSVNDLLGVQTMAGRAGSDQVHKTWLWWEHPQPESTMQIVRRHIQNELEGQSKISLIGGAKKPEVVEVQPVVPDDLLLEWQEMLIRMIANAMDMSAMSLGIEHDINRAVGQVLSDKDYRTAVVPRAKRLEEGLTRRVLHRKLGWHDIRFKFVNLEDPDVETQMDICAKMYSGNAETPNGWRKRMGMKPLNTPLADLTQIEGMLLMSEAAALSQSKLADQAAEHQQDMAEQQHGHTMEQMKAMPPGMMPPPGGLGGPPKPGMIPGAPGTVPPGRGAQMLPQGPGKPNAVTNVPPQAGAKPPQPGMMPPPKPAGGGGGAGAGASGGKGATGYGLPPNPKKLSMPKFPIASVGYTAAELAQMPPDKLKKTVDKSGAKTSDVMKSMDQQEPGIIEQLSDEIKEFLEQRLKDEEKENKSKPISPKLLEKWKKELATKFGDDNRRAHDLATWLSKGGNKLNKQAKALGTPGAQGDIGRPGTSPVVGDDDRKGKK